MHALPSVNQRMFLKTAHLQTDTHGALVTSLYLAWQADAAAINAESAARVCFLGVLCFV